MNSYYEESSSEEFSPAQPFNANAVMDWAVILVTALLLSLGLISIYSATYDAGMSEYFTKKPIFTDKSSNSNKRSSSYQKKKK